MSLENLQGIWRQAYLDLHVAYLATLRIRHERRQDPASEMARDMELADPFGLGDENGPDAIRKWQEIWEKHGGGGDMGQVMTAATEAIKNHWDSWADLTKAYPVRFKSTKSFVPADEFMTSTSASRGTMIERAKLFEEAWAAHSGDS